MKSLLLLSNALQMLNQKLHTATAVGFLNLVFYSCLIVFVASCSSNTEGYYKAQTSADSTKMSEVPITSIPYNGATAQTKGLSLANREITSDGADTSASKYAVKTVKEMGTEVVTNTTNALAQAEEKVRQLKEIQLQNSSSSEIYSIPDTTAKIKSPATKKAVYNCPCMDKRKVEKGTTPTGLIAYMKNKYPNMNINEFKRINKPGITDSRNFKAGIFVCFKRQPCK